jgi:hypothetical protein
MPTWLSDPSNTFYILALVFALVAVGLWVHKKDRPNLVRAAAVVGLVVLVVLIDLGFKSPREESVDKVKEISAAINDKDWGRFEANLSSGFEYKGHDKAKFVEKVKSAVTAHGPVTTAWDFKVPDDLKPKGPDEFLVQFEGKAEAAGKPFMAHIVATFVKDPDGQWRLKTFTAYDYIQKRQPIDVPGL